MTCKLCKCYSLNLNEIRDVCGCKCHGHEHKWRFDESQTKAFCNCGQASSATFWEQVDKGNIKDRWRNK